MRPSPERLERQVRSLANAQSTLHTMISEERSVAADTSKQLIDSVTQTIEKQLGGVMEAVRSVKDQMSALSQSQVELISCCDLF